MKYRLIPLLLLCSAGFAAETPAAAVIVQSEKTLDNIFITSETLDGVEYVLGSADSQAKGSLKRKEYIKIDYKDADDVDFLKGGSDFANKNYEKAAANYANATKSSRYAWVKELSYVRAAEAYIQLKNWDGALGMIAQLETKYPASVNLPQAAYLRGLVESERGNADAADKAFAALAAKADWGFEAQALGLMGQAKVRRQAKKFGDAAAVLGGAFAKLKPEANPEQFGQIGLQLAEDLAAAGTADKALDTYVRLCYAPIDHAMQGQAHYAAAKLLSERAGAGDLIAAFDHAVIATIIRGGDAQSAAKAKALAKELAKKLEADPEFAKNKVEYLSYLNLL